MGIFEGVSNKDIAENLVISSNAVSNHIDNILSKLQVAGRHSHAMATKVG